MRKFLISAMLTISLCLYAQVGIQTSTPDLNSDLTLGSPDKGLLLNRVALKNLSSPNPLSENAPAGMLVYNTQTTPDLSPGLYVYDSNYWEKVMVKTPSQGNKIIKLKYRGRPLDPPTLKIPEMNMEFRFDPEYNANIEIRLLTPPLKEVNYYIKTVDNEAPMEDTVIFTPENYNIWVSPYVLQYIGQLWGILISTISGTIPGSISSKSGAFYGFNHYKDPANNTDPANQFHLLTFHLY